MIDSGAATSAAPVQGPATGDTLAEAFLNAARQRPSAWLTVASAQRPAAMALADVEQLARRAAGGLRRAGIGPGDVVAMQLPGWLEAAVLCAAVALCGGVILPFTPGCGAAHLSFLLRRSGARALVTPGNWMGVDHARAALDAGDAPSLRLRVAVGTSDAPGVIDWDALLDGPAVHGAVPRGADDLALLVYTSGTTGEPKGVMHSHRTLLAEVNSLFLCSRDAARPVLSPWPPGHIAGFTTLMRFWTCGVGQFVMDRWDPAEAARLVETHRIAATSGTPYHLTALLDAADAAGRDLSSLRDYLAGATPIPPSLVQRCEDRGLPTWRAYGLSEHPTISMGCADDPLAKRLHTDGRPCPGVEVRILDDEGNDLPVGAEGEIVSRGPDRFVGYQDPAHDAGALLPGGWLRTGDIGRLDEDGYLAITDRKKDIVIRGGENIASREVEDVLATMPGVREAAVVGRPDERLGERVCAFLVVDGAVPDIAAIGAHFAARGVMRQKTPEHLVVVETLPRTVTGKVRKDELRRLLRAALDSKDD